MNPLQIGEKVRYNPGHPDYGVGQVIAVSPSRDDESGDIVLVEWASGYRAYIDAHALYRDGEPPPPPIAWDFMD